MANPFTKAREALNTCVTRYDQLLSLGRPVFVRVFKFEDDLPSLSETDISGPAFTDYPAIAIFPTQTIPRWYQAQQQQLSMFFDVQMWTQGWEIEQAEELIYKVRSAIWKYKQSGTQLYVAEQTGYLPQTTGPITYKANRTGGKKAPRTKFILTRMQVLLQGRDNPMQ